jgi:hypothetical protein
MKKTTLALWISVLVLVVPLVAGQVTTGAEPESPDGLSEYIFYWFIGEDAANTTVYLYAKQKTDVTFSGTNDDEVTVEVGPREFASFNVEDLGYGIEEKWFYMEMNSNHPVMIVIDKEIFLRLGEDRYETIHGDRTGARPATELQTEYYMANGDSGAEDDYLVVYAPEEATFTAKRLTNDGEVFEKTVTVNGMFVSPVVSIWLGKSNPIYEGYSLIIKSDKPIAANLFEELPWWPNLWTGSGKYLGSFGTSQFYRDYLSFEYRPWGWGNIYTPEEAELVFLDKLGDEVTTMPFPGEGSASTPTTRYRDLGYEVWPQPYLVRVQSEDDFVHGEYTPYATEVMKSSAYMGYNTSNSFLELFAFEDAEVTVLDGQSGGSVHLSIEKETLYNYTLVEDLGFEPDKPFLASVLSSQEIYQQVRIPIEPRLIPYQSMYLRHYPIAIGPPLKVDFILDPKTLNLDSKGRWVTGYLTFPPGFSPSDVDTDTILLQNLLKPERTFIDGDTLVLKFNRKDLQDILEPGEEVLIEITGNFHSGLAFYGSTTIRAI